MPSSDPADPMRSRAAARVPRLAGVYRRAFGIDARALAAFRIGLAGYVLSDLLLRTRELRFLYTDDGVLPSSVLAGEYPLLATLSVHAHLPTVRGQAVLFGLAGVAAVGLLIGVRTRLLAVGLAVWYGSLFARNPFVLHGADALLLTALFLGAFLPLGTRWAVAARPTSMNRRNTSLASAVLLLQLVSVYLANAALKARSDLWMRGDAVGNVLQLDQYSVILGPLLAEMGGLLTAINWLWMGMLVASPALLITDGWLRTAVVGAFAAAHIGMGLTMSIRLFPLIVLVLLVLYLPPVFWNRLEGIRDRAPSRLGGEGRDGPGSEETGRPSPPAEQPASSRVRRVGSVLVLGLLVIVLFGTVVWPVAAVVDAPGAAGTIGDEYPYTLFAPNPPTDMAGIGLTVELSDGTERNLPRGDPIDPADRAGTIATDRSHLQFRYLNQLRHGSEAKGDALGEHLCRQAEQTFATDAVESGLYVVQEPSPVTGGGERTVTEVVIRPC